MLAAGAFAARLRVEERRAAETAVRPALWQSEAQAISRTLRASEVVTGSGRISGSSCAGGIWQRDGTRAEAVAV
jgi:hypothetical protein